MYDILTDGEYVQPKRVKIDDEEEESDQDNMLVQDDQRSMTKSIRRTVEVKVREQLRRTNNIMLFYWYVWWRNGIV